MVDRVYKESLPALRESLEQLKGEFSKLGKKTDWSRLRVEPVLDHVKRLEQLLGSEEFSGESARLGKGVRLFHSDLVYLRENVKGLKELLRSETPSHRERSRERRIRSD
jgi:hypothetical protein